MKYQILLIVVLILSGCATTQRESTIQSPVMDEADILTTEDEARLNNLIQDLKTSVGSEIAVFTTRTLNGVQLNDASLKKAEELRLGRKDKDDGLLFFVAVDDRQARIEVGYGLEAIIKDEVAAEIIRNELVPHFKEGRFGDGIENGVIAAIALIRQNESLIGKRP